MPDTRNLRRWLIATLGSLALLLSACGGGDEAATATAPQSQNGRATDAQPANGSGAAEEEGRPVHAETLAYADVDDRLVYGHFASPSDMIEPLPAVIVVHDWWGLNDDTRAAANRLASYGYIVLAVDLYGGDIVDEVDAARRKVIPVIENPQHVEANIRQALDFLEFAGAPKTAVLGWGFGGRWSLNSAMWFPGDVDAAVIYYGQVMSDQEVLQLIEGPVLGLFGQRDRSVTIDAVSAFGEAMEALGKDITIHSYPGIGHAFADPARPTYDADTTADAWRRTADFLARALAPDEEE